MKISYLRPASLEIEKAVQWYKKRSLDAPFRLLEKIDETTARIAENPSQFPQHGSRCRAALVPIFPYIIYFQVLATEIRIVAVSHAKRKPQYFSKRLSAISTESKETQ